MAAVRYGVSSLITDRDEMRLMHFLFGFQFIFFINSSLLSFSFRFIPWPSKNFIKKSSAHDVSHRKLNCLITFGLQWHRSIGFRLVIFENIHLKRQSFWWFHCSFHYTGMLCRRISHSRWALVLQIRVSLEYGNFPSISISIQYTNSVIEGFLNEMTLM